MATQAQPRIGVKVETFGRIAFLASSDGRHEHAPARPGSVSGYRDTNSDFQIDLSPQPPSDQRYEEVCDAIGNDNPRRCAVTSHDGVAELQQSVGSEKEDQDRDHARRNKRGTHEEE